MSTSESASGQSKRAWRFVPFAIVATIAIGLFLIPAFIIQPFRYQSPRALSTAIALKQLAPFGTLIGFLLCIAMLLLLWPIARRTGRILLGTAIVLVAASTVMARLNYFEWMFHPVRQAGFESANQTKLDNGEMVLSLEFNHDARAYPIREMAYHHILNDVVGGVPVAVTY